MKRRLPILAVVASLALSDLCQAQTPSPFDLGPGDKGATLRQPGSEPVGPPPTAPSSAALQNLWKNNPATNPNPLASLERKTAPSRPGPEINDDIKVTPNAGEWLISVMAYTGDNGPVQARKFVAELRSTYRLNAYTFTKGADENHEARQKAEEERQRQLKALHEAGLTNVDIPYRLRYYKVDEQTAVLIGGYKTREDAVADLKARIRNLPLPDPKKVDLDRQYFADEITDSDGKRKVNLKKEEYVNPFKTSAFPVLNPTVKHSKQSQDDLAAEVRYLRDINSGEAFSLFQCHKKYTLAVKQYQTAATLQQNPNDAKAFQDRQSQQRIDYAAKNAHNIAEAFRKAGGDLKETYVLHARYCSYVTVGGFDSVNDPRLKALQRTLTEYFKEPRMRPLEMMEPVPMEVPH